MADVSKKSKAKAVRDYFSEHPKAKARDVVETLSKQGVEVDPRYVWRVKARAKAVKTKALGLAAKYPRHNLERALRVPKAILVKNAGRECTQQESASFAGVSYNKGPYVVVYPITRGRMWWNSALPANLASLTGHRGG